MLERTSLRRLPRDSWSISSPATTPTSLPAVGWRTGTPPRAILSRLGRNGCDAERRHTIWLYIFASQLALCAPASKGHISSCREFAPRPKGSASQRKEHVRRIRGAGLRPHRWQAPVARRQSPLAHSPINTTLRASHTAPRRSSAALAFSPSLPPAHSWIALVPDGCSPPPDLEAVADGLEREAQPSQHRGRAPAGGHAADRPPAVGREVLEQLRENPPLESGIQPSVRNW